MSPYLPKHNPTYWSSMSVIRNLILLGSKNDYEVAEVCEAAGIEPDHLNNLDIKVPLQSKILVIKKLLSLSRDKDLGLHIGEKASPPMLGQVGHLQESSKDVLSAFGKKPFLLVRHLQLYMIDELRKEMVLLVVLRAGKGIG